MSISKQMNNFKKQMKSKWNLNEIEKYFDFPIHLARFAMAVECRDDLIE